METSANYSSRNYRRSQSVRSSYAARRGASRRILPGDKIYAAVTLNGCKVVEFVMERANDMAEVLSELRYFARKHTGLAALYLRNLSQGWSLERPLMLYGPSRPASVSLSGTASVPRTASFSASLPRSSSFSASLSGCDPFAPSAASMQAPRVSFPWQL